MKLSVVILWISWLYLATTTTNAEDSSDVEDFRQRINDDDSGEVSRVSIKVFRGADREANGKHYAPWGFWIRQPSGH